MADVFIKFLVAATILGLIPGFIAWRKGHPFFLYWISAFLGFEFLIIAVIVAITTPVNQAKLDRRRLAHRRGVKRVKVEEKSDVLGMLERLQKLKENGALTEEEFQIEKTKLIGRNE